jgi:hypothetical protein
MRLNQTGLALGALGFLALTLGCAEGDDGGSATGGGSEPLYAVESLIFGDEGSFSYVALVPALEARDRVLLSEAREFPEYAQADALDGRLIVSSGDAPTLTSYEVTDDGEWIEGDAISFSKYMSIPVDTSIYVSAEKAFVPFDTTSWVTWNPETFELGDEIAAPDEIPLARGDNDELLVWRGHSYELRGETLFQPYYWADETFHAYTRESAVSVVDVENDRVKSVFEAPCPHAHITSQDSKGNLYFSNGQGSIAAALLSEGHAKNCFFRVNAGEETIDESSITYFSDLTDGREGSNVFVVNEKLAIFNVYHAELDDLGEDAEFDAVDYSESYHLWTLDLETFEAAPMENIDYSGGQVVAYDIDGRLLLTIPAPDYSETAVYEISSDGRPEKLFDVEGWAFKVFRVR